ncbi:MAG: zinc dependent phospholipase C family protein [Archaeoglobaceae archaeon]|nr:zinc dependent phospholipase C family protein [Archaeoglobaceae archaeon]MDW8118580.1 zinc dependent phospholipase C family protein [Archaeoglobaceae archaeon]
MWLKRLLVLVLLLSPTLAWDWDTHRWFAEKVCDEFNCNCYLEIKNGSIAPDRDFKDTNLHHCYDPSTCIEGDEWKCPTIKRCPAMDKAEEWLEKAKVETGCNKWYALGVASHYWLDSKCFWHQVQDENYTVCHKPFEDKVGDRFYKGQTAWEVCQCDVCVSYSNFESWLSEFKGLVLSSQTPDITQATPTPTTTPTTPETIKTPKTDVISTPVQSKDLKKIEGFEILLALSAMALLGLRWRKN